MYAIRSYYDLFSLYYRGEGARGSKQVGTGLGLYIVRTFVEAHQGTVEVDSRPGRGTTRITSYNVCYTKLLRMALRS